MFLNSPAVVQSWEFNVGGENCKFMMAQSAATIAFLGLKSCAESMVVNKGFFIIFPAEHEGFFYFVEYKFQVMFSHFLRNTNGFQCDMMMTLFSKFQN